jgi:hypothetical protein
MWFEISGTVVGGEIVSRPGLRLSKAQDREVKATEYIWKKTKETMTHNRIEIIHPELCTPCRRYRERLRCP